MARRPRFCRAFTSYTYESGCLAGRLRLISPQPTPRRRPVPLRVSEDG